MLHKLPFFINKNANQILPIYYFPDFTIKNLYQQNFINFIFQK
jgi:hypothetical protein